MENRSFEYTYSARRQQEVEAIRSAYLPREEDKLEVLRRLHAGPTRKARAAAIAVGTLGALLLGTGMSLCMTELGAALAWPLGRHILDRERRKIAPQILRLTDELM